MGEPQYIFLMLFSIAINYIFGLMMGKFEHHKSLKKFILAFAVLGNLAVLGYYKYSQFLMDNLNSLFGLSIELEPVPLPIGISFYTFQAMSYVIDVYRKDGYVQKNPINLALYVALFPQLIASTIIRYNDIMDQLKSRVTNVQKFSEGIQIFILG